MSRILPILFNTEMVLAILDGRKTVTRRLIKPQQLIGLLPDKCKNGTPNEFLKEKKYMFKPYCDMTDAELIKASYNLPYHPGNILYVRETWYKDPYRYLYRANHSKREKFYCNGEEIDIKWHPSIHMPKEAARIFLKVKDVRVERLQDMNEVDTAKEGIRTDIQTHRLDDPDFIENFGGIELFKDLWNSTIKKSDTDRYGWNANPWVWVIEFEQTDKPEEK